MRQRFALSLATIVVALAATLGAEQQQVWQPFAGQLRIGSTVAIRTTSGERLTGVLLQTDEDAVTVKVRTRFPEPARRVPLAEIENMEVKEQRHVNFGKHMAIGAATGAALFLALLAGI